MSSTVELPLWLFILILMFAAVTAASHLFIPPVRWFLRRRMERVVAQINTRLARPIEPFALARRSDTILRLIYDPEVAQAVAEHARRTGVREDVAFDTARHYAREIVPSLSASAYFGFAIRAARWLCTRLYDVRVTGGEDRLDPDATVVYVMTHRSNMDYVLVTYVAARRSTLSYAVGEWARIWPLTSLIRAMGAYFIRRRSRNNLYRRVLARYVQLSIRAGVTQAIFPEGALSQSGRVETMKLGLLSYIVSDFDPNGRDVVFVPVSLNYDQVLEDRILVDAAQHGQTRFRGTFPTASAFVLRWLWRRIRGRVRKFGFAGVAIGRPLSLKAFSAADGPVDIKALGEELRHRLSASLPILPVPLAAAGLMAGARTRKALLERMAESLEAARASGRIVHLPEDGLEGALRMALDKMLLRHILTEEEGRLEISPRAERLVAFYAASVSESLSMPHCNITVSA